jgi:hypothetical protein
VQIWVRRGIARSDSDETAEFSALERSFGERATEKSTASRTLAATSGIILVTLSGARVMLTTTTTPSQNDPLPAVHDRIMRCEGRRSAERRDPTTPLIADKLALSAMASLSDDKR